MTCEPLAYSGSGIQVGFLVILASVFLIIGAIVLLMTSRRGRAVGGALLLIGAAAVSMTAGTAGRASALECPLVNNSLTIVQTSVMQGMAPGIGPMPIAGVVRNNGTDSTYIVAIDVRIVGVITAPGGRQGSCDSTDFVLLDTLMPVGRTLAPHGSATFAGASIGMHGKPVNQDACQAATVRLLYTANPD